MFSKTRVTDTNARSQAATSSSSGDAPAPAQAPSERGNETAAPTSSRPQQRGAPSVLSADLTVVGNIHTEGDIVVEGTVDGDIRANQLTIGETAIIKGEVVAEEVVVNGRIVGRVRGLKVRLSAAARVEGDIIHKTIAIESGAHFEGSVQRQEDPLTQGGTKKLAPPAGNS